MPRVLPEQRWHHPLEPRFVRRALHEDLVYCRNVWSSVPNARGPFVAAAPAAVPGDYPGAVGRRFDRPSTGGTRHRSGRRERLEHGRTKGNARADRGTASNTPNTADPSWGERGIISRQREKLRTVQGQDSADPSNGRRNSNVAPPRIGTVGASCKRTGRARTERAFVEEVSRWWPHTSFEFQFSRYLSCLRWPSPPNGQHQRPPTPSTSSCPAF